MQLNSTFLFLTPETAFLIGSIDEINTKISKLDRKLHTYAELVIDSQASDHLEYFKPPSAKQRELYQKKGKALSNLNEFVKRIYLFLDIHLLYLHYILLNHFKYYSIYF